MVDCTPQQQLYNATAAKFQEFGIFPDSNEDGFEIYPNRQLVTFWNPTEEESSFKVFYGSLQSIFRSDDFYEFSMKFKQGIDTTDKGVQYRSADIDIELHDVNTYDKDYVPSYLIFSGVGIDPVIVHAGRFNGEDPENTIESLVINNSEALAEGRCEVFPEYYCRSLARFVSELTLDKVDIR